ncbi:MAG: nuclear transport factor 2 family protein [Chryseolinea sp.]
MDIRYFLIPLLIPVTICTSLHAQKSTDEKAISAVIEQLFTGMRQGDSAMVHSVFSHQVTLATISRGADGKSALTRETSIAAFLKSVGTPHPNAFNEEIWDLEISVDGEFAQVWCDYAFYVGNKFSHCGVDAFQLYHGSNGWKIFHLADTRRSSDCVIPKDVQRKHNQ